MIKRKENFSEDDFFLSSFTKVPTSKNSTPTWNLKVFDIDKKTFFSKEAQHILGSIESLISSLGKPANENQLKFRSPFLKLGTNKEENSKPADRAKEIDRKASIKFEEKKRFGLGSLSSRNLVEKNMFNKSRIAKNKAREEFKDEGFTEFLTTNLRKFYNRVNRKKDERAFGNLSPDNLKSDQRNESLNGLVLKGRAEVECRVLRF